MTQDEKLTRQIVMEVFSAFPDSSGTESLAGSIATYLKYLGANSVEAVVLAGQEFIMGKIESHSGKFRPTTAEWIKRAEYHDTIFKRTAAIPDMQWLDYLRRWVESGMWLEEAMGPPPNSPRCMVPKHLLDEFGLKAPRQITSGGH